MSTSWDAKYGAEAYFYGTEPNGFLSESAAALPCGGDVLCLGEGEGRNAVFLATCGHRVTALDQSAVGLAKAARLAAARGVAIDTLVVDLSAYRLEPRRWDGIVSIWCHLPSALRRDVHRQVVEALRPGGVVVLVAYTPAQLRHRTGGPSDVDLLPTLDDLREDFQGLQFLRGQETECAIHEGRGHRGLSAVVQLVARKAP